MAISAIDVDSIRDDWAQFTKSVGILANALERLQLRQKSLPL